LSRADDVLKVRTLGWSCDGRRLASGSSDTTMRIWTPERADSEHAFLSAARVEWTLIQVEVDKNSGELRGHTAEVQSLAWEPSGPERVRVCVFTSGGCLVTDGSGAR
jgi:THO complex subunit 3